MPDVIRHPVSFWIPAYAGMTILGYLTAGVISSPSPAYNWGICWAGAIIIEQVFSLPGLGRLFLFAVYQRDFPLIQGGVVFVAFVFSFINFTVDILYSVLNPKIRIT
jgi:ABC-type dipeptide/oligopeptide/nickel transport system permease component